MYLTEASAMLQVITPDALRVIENAARVCYKSEHKIGDGSAAQLIDKLFKRNHLTPLEHAHATFRFVTNRGVTHELVRHRLASFCQESTRYCNYNGTRFGGQITVIPPKLRNPSVSTEIWEEAMLAAERAYNQLVENGEPPGVARSVLPNSTKAEIVMTCNFREWLHVFSLRTASEAHEDIREIICCAKAELAGMYPVIFDRG